jgi:hypothetical protein
VSTREILRLATHLHGQLLELVECVESKRWHVSRSVPA